MKASGGNINENATILWDFDIYTDRKIQANRSDIAVKSHDFLVDISGPGDTNVSSLKTIKQLSKCKDLEIKVTKMWHFKTTTLPVVIDTLGVLTNAVPNYVSRIPGSFVFNRTSKSNTHEYRIYPAKGTVNVFFFNTRYFP